MHLYGHTYTLMHNRGLAEEMSSSITMELTLTGKWWKWNKGNMKREGFEPPVKGGGRLQHCVPRQKRRFRVDVHGCHLILVPTVGSSGRVWNHQGIRPLRPARFLRTSSTDLQPKPHAKTTLPRRYLNNIYQLDCLCYKHYHLFT